MQIVRWLRKYLKSDSLILIEEAVKAAEFTTAGEIVPVVVRRSSGITHIPFLLGSSMLVLLLAFDIVALELQLFRRNMLWLSLGVAFIPILMYILAAFDSVQRWILNVFSKDDLIKQVNMRAENIFFETGMIHTKHKTGILLFISLMERRAVVLADKAIADVLPKDTWEHVVQLLVEGAKKRDLGQGFVDAIKLCSIILKDKFPIRTDDIDELKNTLIIQE